MKTTTRSLFTEVSDLLIASGVFRGGVHVGAVPTSLDTYPDGTVMEYAVVWPRVPSPIDDKPLNDKPSVDGRSYQFQTTLVSDDLLFLGDMIDVTDTALTGIKVGGGYLNRVTEFEPDGILYDETLTPTRYWAPMIWRVNAQ